MTRAKSPKLQIPLAGEDRPNLSRVGIIAACGFVLGIVWPWLAGVTLAPRPPMDELKPIVEDKKPAARKDSPASQKKPSHKKSVRRLDPNKRIKVGEAVYTSCRDSEDRKVSACDPIPIEELVVPKIEALEDCEAAKNAEGVLSLGLRIEFESGKIERYFQGKSTTLPEAESKGLLACAEASLGNTSFAKVPHNHASYTVFYVVELAALDEAATDNEARDAEAGDLTSASGMATVAWVAARVRSGPSKDSKEVARLASGARVKVIGKQGDWYKVRWNSKDSEGWVFKGAIGL